MANVGAVVGRLTKDVEVVPVGETKVAKGSIAVRGAGPKEDGKYTAGFFNFEAWGRLAEILEEHTQKGSLVSLSFRMKQDRWETESGKGQAVKLDVTGVELVESKKTEEGSGSDKAESSSKKKDAEDDYDPFADE